MQPYWRTLRGLWRLRDANGEDVERLIVRPDADDQTFSSCGYPKTRLEEAGVQVPAVLRQARLPGDLFEQHRILVTTQQLFALSRAIGEVSGDRAIGLAWHGNED